MQFDLEGQGQLPHKTIVILTKIFYISGPNLVILAWTVDELSPRQAHNWRTHRHTHIHTRRQRQYPKASDNKTGVIVRQLSIRVKISKILSRVTLKFDGWPWKTIGHIYYVASSFVHHFITISEFKLKLQSGNARFGSKSANFCPVWPWNLMVDIEKQWGTSSMLLQALCIILYPLVNSNWVTVRKHPIWVKIDNFFSRVTFKFDGWPWRTIGHLT